jgi:hypothetical protein
MYVSKRSRLGIAAWCALAGSAHAAQWSVDGDFGNQFQYNDNISLRTNAPSSVFGYLMAPVLRAKRVSDVLNIELRGQGDIRRYDDPQWDCDNYSLGAENAYKDGRGTFRLNGGYRSTCSYSQQITDTGLLIPASQNTSYNIAPSWAWRLSSRDQVQVETSYSKSLYTGTASLGSGSGATFSNSETYAVNLGGSHDWTRSLSSNGGLYFSRNKYTGNTASTQDLVGFQVGGNYDISRKWGTSFGAGLRWVDTESGSATGAASGGKWVMGNVANVSIRYNDELTHFSVGYSNALVPSAIGETLELNSVFSNFQYEFLSNLSVVVASNYYTSKNAGGETRSFSRDYLSASAGLVWKFARNWDLQGRYTYQTQKFPVVNQSTDVGGTATSNAVMLFLNYNWDGIQISR